MSNEMPVELPTAPVEREALLDFLDANSFEVSTVDHPPLFTVEDSQKLRGEIPGGHTKNLFLKDKKDNFFLLTAQEDTQVDLKTLHKLIGGSSRFSFGKPDKLLEFLGVTPGAVSALGLINDRGNALTFALDKRLLEHDVINCHPLTNDATTSIKKDDLLAFVRATGHEPIIVDLEAQVVISGGQ